MDAATGTHSGNFSVILVESLCVPSRAEVRIAGIAQRTNENSNSFVLLA